MLSTELTITINTPDEVNKRGTINSHEISEQSTQTEHMFEVKIKEEPHKSPILIKQEIDTNDEYVPQNASDSDDNLLIEIKKKKRLKKESERNGHVKKQVQKKRDQIKTQILQIDFKETEVNLELVKEESDDDFNNLDDIEKEMFYCCICFFKCEIKMDMLQHYK